MTVHGTLRCHKKRWSLIGSLRLHAPRRLQTAYGFWGAGERATDISSSAPQTRGLTPRTDCHSESSGSLKQSIVPLLSRVDFSLPKGPKVLDRKYTRSESQERRSRVLLVTVLLVSQMTLVLKDDFNSSAYTGRKQFMKRDYLFNTFFKGSLI